MNIVNLLLKSDKIDTSVKDEIFGKTPDQLLNDLKARNTHRRKK